VKDVHNKDNLEWDGKYLDEHWLKSI